MRRRRTVVRRISRAVATVAVGGLLGFLVPTVIADLSPQPEVEAVVAESPVARQFIKAFIADDQATLTEHGRGGGDHGPRRQRSRPNTSASTRRSTSARTTPASLSLHAYAAHVLTARRRPRTCSAGGSSAEADGRRSSCPRTRSSHDRPRRPRRPNRLIADSGGADRAGRSRREAGRSRPTRRDRGRNDRPPPRRSETGRASTPASSSPASAGSRASA